MKTLAALKVAAVLCVCPATGYLVVKHSPAVRHSIAKHLRHAAVALDGRHVKPKADAVMVSTPCPPAFGGGGIGGGIGGFAPFIPVEAGQPGSGGGEGGAGTLPWPHVGGGGAGGGWHGGSGGGGGGGVTPPWTSPPPDAPPPAASPTPEPGTWLMLGAGMIAAGATLRGQRHLAKRA